MLAIGTFEDPRFVEVRGNAQAVGHGQIRSRGADALRFLIGGKNHTCRQYRKEFGYRG